jgi:hypothetical protein
MRTCDSTGSPPWPTNSPGRVVIANRAIASEDNGQAAVVRPHDLLMRAVGQPWAVSRASEPLASRRSASSPAG